MKYVRTQMGRLRAGHWVIAIITLATSLTMIGCDTAGKEEGPATRPALAGIFTPPAKTGSQLWAENCTRCHYSRPPTQYSAQQWDVIVTHMRLRADLTGQETREITKFLQGSN
ncbi:MAG: cytochrome c, class [Phycisphaerales bacterium]|nr:cytochrome c, class [Phycisphaerales bacterium]